MSIEQLVREAMREQADTVVSGPAGLGVRARAQADGIRSRRRHTAAAAVLVALTAFAALSVNPFRQGDDDLRPSQELPTVPVRGSFAGRILIESTQTTNGRVLDLTATPPDGSEWQLMCTGVGSTYVVHYALDSALEGSAPCSLFAELGQSPAPGLEPPGYRVPASVADGERRNLRMWLTEAGGEEIVEPDGAILVAAAYALPTPVAELAGFEVLPVEEALGQEWSVVEYAGSDPGEQSFTLTLPTHPQETMLQLLLSGSATADVRLSVDGEEVTTDPAAYALGSANLGDLIPPGAHTVTLRIEGAAPADAQLGIVRRERVP